MKRPSILQATLAATLSLTGCKFSPDTVGGDDDSNDNSDVKNALGQLPDVNVLMWSNDGVLPTYMVGEMATVGLMNSDSVVDADAALHGSLQAVLAPMRLKAENVVAKRLSVDSEGNRFVHYAQKHNGLDVINGEIVVGVSPKGSITSVNGPARGDISAELGSNAISQNAAISAATSDSRFVGMSAASPRLVYIQTDDGVMHKAYETVVTGANGLTPVRDKVYVDVDSGSIVADYPQVHTAENRQVYSANNTENVPGTLKRSEGQAATSDSAVNGAYDGTGDTWNMYHTLFNRDSYNNAGATLISSVHFSTNYCNAYWDGDSQMVYGDGDPSQNCLPLASPAALDVTSHELTHAVTQYESGLNYSGESGGMNEHWSDFAGGTITDLFVANGRTGTLTDTGGTEGAPWLIGEGVISGSALRWMCNPHKDGASADYYTGSVGGLDVHYSSGVGNLIACLTSRGGAHPTGKSTIVAPGIGPDKTARIWYKMQSDILTPTSNYAAMATAAIQAAQQLGYDQATQDAVQCAFAEVGVGTAPTSCGGGGGGGGGDVVLANNQAATNLSGATGAQTFYKITVPAGQSSLVFTLSGGTGDADMYTKAGAHPTLTTYDCRPYVNGNAETCTVTNPAAGDYFVMLNGYAAYSGVSLKATYTAGGGGGGGTCTTSGNDTCLTNGQAVTGISGAKNNKQYWRINVPANKTYTITISGGTGDADLYTRFNSRPTTSTYSCRPYISGNGETCTGKNTTAGDEYIMLNGYTAYTGVTLKASY